ncbi:response regulator [Thermosynechococcus sp.]|uniref:response regulator n=1 Tax=Thermosynechococcus sp. TaxID=2814275 RepID=UPI00391D3D5E
MDIGLPRLDGIAAIQRLKQEFPHIHGVILTSHQSALEAAAALPSGAAAYCIKGETVRS